MRAREFVCGQNARPRPSSVLQPPACGPLVGLSVEIRGGGAHLLKFISSPALVPSGTDMAPGEEKQLYVAFWSGGVLREVLLSDTTAAKLPACAAATAVSDPVRRAALLARAAAVLGVQLA